MRATILIGVVLVVLLQIAAVQTLSATPSWTPLCNGPPTRLYAALLFQSRHADVDRLSGAQRYQLIRILSRGTEDAYPAYMAFSRAVEATLTPSQMQWVLTHDTVSATDPPRFGAPPLRDALNALVTAHPAKKLSPSEGINAHRPADFSAKHPAVDYARGLANLAASGGLGAGQIQALLPPLRAAYEADRRQSELNNDLLAVLDDRQIEQVAARVQAVEDGGAAPPLAERPKAPVAADASPLPPAVPAWMRPPTQRAEPPEANLRAFELLAELWNDEEPDGGPLAEPRPPTLFRPQVR